MKPPAGKEKNRQMRIILFAGKGGVGKTSIAAATGLELAKRGRKTIVMSLDTAHSLSDAFDLDKQIMDRNRGEPIKVRERLWIQELDIQEEVQRHWADVYQYITNLFNLTGLDEVLSEELAIIPGMEEISSLLHINKYYKERNFDVILLDCAPTGESLRFISIPTTLEWYMRKLFKIEKQLVRITRPMARRIYSVPLPDDHYFDTIQALYEKLQGIEKVLIDPKTTSVRLVTNPEKIVIKETQRAFMYFCLYGLCVDAVIINKVFPERALGGFLKGWKEIQKEYIQMIHEHFSPLPILTSKHMQAEVVGDKDLAKLARGLYGSRDPYEVFYSESPYQFRKDHQGYQLIMKLPFVEKGDIKLGKTHDELIVRVGNFKQHVLLPRSIMALDPSGARIRGKNLIVYFGGKDGQEGIEEEGGRGRKGTLPV